MAATRAHRAGRGIAIGGLFGLLLGPAALRGVAGDETGAAWRLTREMPAAEARQAAAAEGQFVYAIDNRLVAKYDRATGKRLAVSQGAAEHLNSGFFHEGLLYCAHSNYPNLPEQSEIKRFDPDSLRLETFRDFGNYGGSLTWVVHERNSWWCNFARYGAANGETFLVRFDEAWQEQQRWTYPDAVIRALHGRSVSGGIWHGDSLLVTGHDDPVLFRLRLPDEGTVLELIERQGVPFTGQGIARDPATGGLVGIDRARRRVLFAEPAAAPR